MKIKIEFIVFLLFISTLGFTQTVRWSNQKFRGVICELESFKDPVPVTLDSACFRILQHKLPENRIYSLSVNVAKEGSVKSVKIFNNSGSNSNFISKELLKLYFTPAIWNGQPVEKDYYFTFIFDKSEDKSFTKKILTKNSQEIVFKSN